MELSLELAAIYLDVCDIEAAKLQIDRALRSSDAAQKTRAEELLKKMNSPQGSY